MNAPTAVGDVGGYAPRLVVGEQMRRPRAPQLNRARNPLVSFRKEPLPCCWARQFPRLRRRAPEHRGNLHDARTLPPCGTARVIVDASFGGSHATADVLPRSAARSRRTLCRTQISSSSNSTTRPPVAAPGVGHHTTAAATPAFWRMC